MTTGERLVALERVEKGLLRRGVSLVENCWDDPALWDEAIVSCLRRNEADPDALCSMAYITPHDSVALRYGQQFFIHIALPPGDDGRDSEQRLKAVAEIVHQELTIAGIPHTWAGGRSLRIRLRQPDAQDAQAVAWESIVL